MYRDLSDLIEDVFTLKWGEDKTNY
jgi:hypothetical protein